MSDRKPRARTRRELDEESAADYYQHYQHHPNPPRYQPPQHMAAYAAYPPPPRQQFAYPPYPQYGHARGGEHLSSSSAAMHEGFHPPAHPYPPRPSATAVTPESGQLLPAEFISPPSNVKRRQLTPGSSITPSKKARKGKVTFLFVVLTHRTRVVLR